MAQLNDLIVNGYSRFLNSAYGNLNGSATSALCAANAAQAGAASWVSKSDNRNYNVAFSLDNAFNYRNTLTFNPSSNTLSSTNINTVTLSGTTVKGVTISGTNITAATTIRGTNLSGTNISGATKTMTVDNLISSATRTLPTVNNNTISISTGASPATASFTLNQNSNKTITLGSMALKASGDFSLTSHNHSYTLSGNGTAVNVSAGINFKPSGSNIKFYVSGNDIYISAKDTTGTDTNVTQNSSTENSALPFILKRTTAGNETNTVKYSSAVTFNPSTRGLTIVDINNEERVSITPTQLSCTYSEMSIPRSVYLSDLIGVTSYFSNGSAKSACTATYAVSAGAAPVATHQFSSHSNFSTYFNATSANSALTSKSALSAGYASTTNTAIKVNSAIYVQDFGDTSRYVQVSWGGQDVSSAKIGAGASRNNGTQYLAAFYTNDGSTTSNIGKIKPVDVSHVQVASADTVDGLHVATGTIGTATNYLYFC